MPHHERNHSYQGSGPERGRTGTDRERFGPRYEERDHPNWQHDADTAWERDPRRPPRGRGEQRAREQSTWDRGRFDDDRNTRLMHWDSLNRGGDYFGTGIEHGAYSTQPGARATGGGELWEPGEFGDDRGRGWTEPRHEDAYRTSGDYETYGQSRYGAQSGYGRDYGDVRTSRSGYGQDFRERFAEERYGREPDFGYGFGQSAYKRESGQYRGIGPKGYERSDERLREIICERLTDEPSVDASEVSLEVKDKVVRLSGFVSDRRTKYAIEDLVERCGGVKDIDNQVRVKRG